MIESITAMSYDRTDFIESFLIRIISFFTSTCQKFFLLCTFGIQYVETYQTFVHTDGILPIVGRWCILAGIMNTYGGIFQHLIHKYLLTGPTYMLTHEVGSLHTFFHFIGNHVSPVASGESHDKGEITFLYSGEADSQMFLNFQRNVVFRIGCRFPIFIRVNTEKRKIPRMTRPHPVIGICSEFTNGRRGSTHHTNVAVHRFDEHIVFVSTIESLKLQFGGGSNFYILGFGKTFCYLAKIAWWQVVDSFWIRIFL